MWTLCEIIHLLPDFPGQSILNLINIILAVIATTGNILIIVAVMRSKQLRTQTATYFILSLAFSDLLVGVVVQPLYSIVLIDWSLKTCHVQYYKFGIAFFTCSVSIGNALCVCLDRMLRITKPFTYELYVTKKRALALCLSIWCTGVGIGFMAIQRETELIMAYGAAAEMMFSLSICIYCSLEIYKVGQEQIHRITKTNMAGIKQKILMERKLAGSLVAVLATIIVCWIPFALVNIMTFLEDNYPAWIVLFKIRLWTVLFGYSKSSINIFIFGLTNRDIKRAIQDILGFEDEPSKIAQSAITTEMSNYGSVINEELAKETLE